MKGISERLEICNQHYAAVKNVAEIFISRETNYNFSKSNSTWHVVCTNRYNRSETPREKVWELDRGKNTSHVCYRLYKPVVTVSLLKKPLPTAVSFLKPPAKLRSAKKSNPSRLFRARVCRNSRQCRPYHPANRQINVTRSGRVTEAPGKYMTAEHTASHSAMPYCVPTPLCWIFKNCFEIFSTAKKYTFWTTRVRDRRFRWVLRPCLGIFFSCRNSYCDGISRRRFWCTRRSLASRRPGAPAEAVALLRPIRSWHENRFPIY